MRLAASGMEGGSPRKIEKHWTLFDVIAIEEHWRQFGPPAHIALAVISASFGNKLTADSPSTATVNDEAEIAALLAQLPMT